MMNSMPFNIEIPHDKLYSINVELSCDPVNLLQSIHSGKMKICPHKNLYTNVYILAILFTITRKWKQFTYPSTDEWINKHSLAIQWDIV